MATAPQLDTGTPIPGEQMPQNDTVIDFEAEAKKMGWTPRDEFKGDEKFFTDAETFYNRAVEYMPIAKATIKKMSDKIERLEKDIKRSSEFFSKSEERAYTRALADIKAKQEAAVEAGDIEAHRAAADELDKLEKPSAAKADDADEAEQRAEEFTDWRRANKWFDENPAMQEYATAQATILSKKKGGFLDKTDLDAITDKVKAKFEDDFTEDAAKPKPRNPVEGVPQNRGRSGGKSFNDLPPEAKTACDRWVKQGLIKSRDDYVKNYDWS